MIRKRGGVSDYGVFSRIQDSCPNIPKGTECMISVGGDGTLVFASKLAMRQGIPIVGVNRGHMGFLCDLDDSTVEAAIDSLFSDEYETEDRMMLRGSIDMDDNEYVIESALNDISIAAGRDMNMITLSVYINGSYLYSVDADGIVLATPTGSTAYNLSCGGPIVDPKNSLILLTPINPHAMNSRSIVLCGDDEIMIELNRRHNDENEYMVITFDGDKRIEIGEGDRLVVKRSEHVTRMIRFSDKNFLQRMSEKFR
jgi:NAD+ kinase